MIKIGLTGSIAMGKSFVTNLLKNMNIDVFDADKVVHSMFINNNKIISAIAKSYPIVYHEGIIDRKQLAKLAFGNTKILDDLEKIIYPELDKEEQKFFRKVGLAGKRLAISDVPLLFESGNKNRYDIVIVVTAPKFLQERRALARDRMTKEKLNSIRKRQLNEWQKKQLADEIIYSGLGKAVTYRKLISILRKL